MSGRKYSEIELAANVREAITCRLAAEETFSMAESLVAALVEAAGKIDSLQSAADSAKETLTAVREQLESVTKQYDESAMMRWTYEEVSERRRIVNRLRTQLETIARSCRESNDAAALRVELVVVLDQMKRGRNEIEPWLRDVYEGFLTETQSLLDEADREMQSTGGMKGVSDRVVSQTARYSTMIENVSKRRAHDSERHYIASALGRVCSELGFSTKLLPQNGPLEDLVVEVNTYAYGIIHFRLELDGTIRSQSEMIQASCAEHFSEIEDRLRTLGVISSFKYEGDQSPVRLRKGEKEIPDSDPGAAMKGDAL